MQQKEARLAADLESSRRREEAHRNQVTIATATITYRREEAHRNQVGTMFPAVPYSSGCCYKC